MRNRLSAVAVLVVLAVAGAACGGGDEGGGGSQAGGKTVKIGMIAPLTGALAALGTGMRNSAQLAIEQADEKGTVEGWNIVFDPQDDAADTKQGAAAAQKLAADPDVVAVIGTLNSSVAQAVQPILDQANIALVSPANTNPSLTMGQNWQTDPKRAYKSYFRVVATDREQGEFAAVAAKETVQRKRAVAIHDKKTYGQGLSSIFVENFKADGGEVVETLEINPGEGDYKAAVTRARGHNPDIIYYGGEYPEAGVIAKNMAELGMRPPNVVLMGGDGIVDQKFVEIAGNEAAQGHYATLVGASADLLAESKQFVDDYKAKFNKEDYSAYGPPTYDATNIVIAALAKVLNGQSEINTQTREEIIAAIAESDYNGVLGTTKFDKFGDTTNRLLTLLRVEGDNFKGLEAKKLTE